jgi:hypothetical protein
LANRELRRRTGRAVLTVLAVSLAAALLTIALTAETKVLDELAKGGPLSGIKVAAAEVDLSQLGQDQAQAGRATILDQAAIDVIASLPSVAAVVPVSTVGATVVVDTPKRDGQVLDAFRESVIGVDIPQVPSLPVTVLNGRLPAPGSTTEVTVDEAFLQRLGYSRPDGEVLLGTTLSMGVDRRVRVGGEERDVVRWTRATIVGVVAQDAGAGQILAPVELVDTSRGWVTAEVSGDGVGSDELDVATATPFAGAFVVAERIDDVGKVRVAVAAIGYSTSAPENLIASVDRYLNVVEIVLTSVGVIALAVAAIGIANASLAAVRERRREIGVLKAVGATDRDIRRIFLVESGSLGFIGGVLGVLLGYVVAVVVATVVNRYLIEQGFEAVPVAVPVVTMVAVALGSTVLAVVAGILPAAKAARLPAREAMGSL